MCIGLLGRTMAHQEDRAIGVHTAIVFGVLPVQNALPIRMLDFMYFADQVCEFHQRWVGTAPGRPDDVHVRRPLANGVENIIRSRNLYVMV